MKCAIFIVLAVCLASAYGELINGAAVAEDCAKEAGVDVERLKEMARTKSYIIDRKVGCYVACVLKDEGVMSKDGVIDGKSEKFVEEPESVECAKLTGVDACDTAARFLECFLKAQQEKEKAAEKKD